MGTPKQNTDKQNTDKQNVTQKLMDSLGSIDTQYNVTQKLMDSLGSIDTQYYASKKEYEKIHQMNKNAIESTIHNNEIPFEKAFNEAGKSTVIKNLQDNLNELENLKKVQLDILNKTLETKNTWEQMISSAGTNTLNEYKKQVEQMSLDIYSINEQIDRLNKQHDKIQIKINKAGDLSGWQELSFIFKRLWLQLQEESRYLKELAGSHANMVAQKLNAVGKEVIGKLVEFGKVIRQLFRDAINTIKKIHNKLDDHISNWVHDNLSYEKYMRYVVEHDLSSVPSKIKEDYKKEILRIENIATNSIEYTPITIKEPEEQKDQQQEDLKNKTIRNAEEFQNLLK